jgi:hypothetical protein
LKTHPCLLQSLSSPWQGGKTGMHSWYLWKFQSLPRWSSDFVQMCYLKTSFGRYFKLSDSYSARAIYFIVMKNKVGRDLDDDRSHLIEPNRFC